MEQQTAIEAKRGAMLTCFISLRPSKEHDKARRQKKQGLVTIPTHATTVSYVSLLVLTEGARTSGPFAKITSCLN
jgi:hypothetical protein